MQGFLHPRRFAARQGFFVCLVYLVVLVGKTRQNHQIHQTH